jgi:cephalosporin hydroxylase
MDATNRDAFINSVTQNYDYFYVNLLLIDTDIAPTQPNPIVRTIKADQFITFGSKFGTQGSLQLLPFQIQTD